jgi:hypothetical protein
MYQHAISVEQFCDLFYSSEIIGQLDAGPTLTTAGKHPALGAWTALQDINPGMLLWSEQPFCELPPVPDIED